MTEPTNESDEKLERMLRRWGAEEAARRQRTAEPARTRKQRLLLRWAPAAAAAVLLLAALVTFHLGRQREGDDASPAEADARVRLLQAEVAELVHELSAASAGTEQAEARAEGLAEQLAEQDSEHQRQLAELRERLNGADEDRLAEAESRIESLRTDLAESRSHADELAGKLAQTEDRLADARAKAERAEQNLEYTRQRLSAAVEEMERMRRDEGELHEARRELEAELNRLEARKAGLWRDIQSAYLGAVETDLPLGFRQRAVERHGLLTRAAAARRDARSAETAELIDRIEVVLTRLMMLPADDEAAEEAFVRLVERSECLSRIETALAEHSEPRVVGVWLMEAKLVLKGAGYVG